MTAATTVLADLLSAEPALAMACPTQHRELPGRSPRWRPSALVCIAATFFLGIFLLGWLPVLTPPADGVVEVWWPAFALALGPVKRAPNRPVSLGRAL